MIEAPAIGVRVQPVGNHRPGTVERIEGESITVRCDCGHRGIYTKENLTDASPQGGTT